MLLVHTSHALVRCLNVAEAGKAHTLKSASRLPIFMEEGTKGKRMPTEPTGKGRHPGWKEAGINPP